MVVMGVAGSGKTTVGTQLAERLSVSFLDADAAHPAANIAKMTSGVPLTDADRAPWLARLRAELASANAIVITCSALKRSYRDVLREAGGVRFLLLSISWADATRRLAHRPGHFMGPAMVDSQFAAFEPPSDDETDITVIDAELPIEQVIALAAAATIG
jgi:gluconokinase